MVDVNHKDITGSDLHEPKPHHASHENGGADELSLEGLSGTSAALAAHAASGIHTDAQSITVRKNSGVDVGTRPRVNLIEGTNITLTVADDPADTEVDVTITAADAPSSPPHVLSYTALLYGGGTDGNVTIAVDTTLAIGTGGVKVMQYNNLIINAGVALQGHASDIVLVILVMNKLTLNGIIRMNDRGGDGGSGNVGDGGDAGAFGGGGGGKANAGFALVAPGGGGGSGQAGQIGAVGLPGVAGYGGGLYHVDGITDSIFPFQAGAGLGGNGNAVGVGAAGVTFMGALHSPLPFEIARYLFGAGGGEGGSVGGNGGTGGGVIWIEAHEIEWGAGGEIQAMGSAGAAGGDIDSGGGGGGAGGLIHIIYGTKVGASVLTVSGGAGGAAGGIGGSAGGAGADGLTLEVVGA